MADQFAPVERFYREVIGLPIPSVPTRLSAKAKKARIEHWREEVQEFEEAETLEDEIDACLDLAWLAIGRVIEMGADVDGHWAELVRANGERVRGTNGKRPNTDGYDAVKPEGWRGPDHTAVLARTDRSRPKIILLGYGRHGKDTAAEILAKRFGLRFTSSSLFCAEKVMMPAILAAYKGHCHGHPSGLPYDGDVQKCFEDRHGHSPTLGDHRTFWYETIAAYCREDPARLIKEIFAAGNDIYVGVRAERELMAARPFADAVIWVDASGRGLPPEPTSSCTVRPDMADFIVHNNGTLEQLDDAIVAAVHSLGLVK